MRIFKSTLLLWVLLGIPSVWATDQNLGVERDLRGSIGSGDFEGAEALGVIQTYQLAEIVIPLPSRAGSKAWAAPVPRIPGTNLAYRPTSYKKSELRFLIPIQYLLKKPDTAEPRRLPNGERVPDVESGELPSLSLGSGVTVYFGEDFGSVYVENPEASVDKRETAVIRSPKGEVVGKRYEIPSVHGHSSGIYQSFKYEALVGKD